MSSSTRGFTLIELLVTVGIIAVLLGILLPVMTRARQAATKTACMSNLRQVGMGVEMYRQDNSQAYPTARYMPEPFLSGSVDPPLTELLRPHVAGGMEVFECPGDRDEVYALAGTSYAYNSALGGQTEDDSWMSQTLGMGPSELPVSHDFDAGRFDTVDGSVHVSTFHRRRNILFADGHAGNY